MNIYNMRKLGSKLATLFGLNPDKILWTPLKQCPFNGYRFNLRYKIDLERSLRLTGISSIFPIDFDIVGINLIGRTSKQIKKTMIHELAHIICPPFFTKKLGWSDIHHSLFNKTLENMLKKTVLGAG